MKATHIQEGKFFDYKNEGTSKISTGDIVVVGTRATVAAADIEAGEVGTVAVGEVYDLPKDSNAIALGAKVYYDATAEKETATASTNLEIGYAIAAAGASASTVRVKFLA